MTLYAHVHAVDGLFLKSRNVARKMFSRSYPRSLAARTCEWQDRRFHEEEKKIRANASTDGWRKGKVSGRRNRDRDGMSLIP